MGSTVPLGKKLALTRTSGAGSQLLKLTGIIDETFDRVKLAAGSEGVLVLDLEGVTRITSFGVREWMLGLRELKAEYYGFVGCRPTLLSQFNMVAGFGARGQLISFYAPYLCPSCGKEAEVLVDLRKQHAAIASLQAPAAQCECGAELELDDVAESYFAYAAAEPAPTPPAAANALIDGGGAVPRLKVQKAVVGAVTVLKLSGPLERASALKRLGDGLEGSVVLCMGEVGATAAEGLAALGQLTRIPDVSLTLAEVGPALAAGLAINPAVCGGARIGTARLPTRCVACRTDQTLELPATTLADPAALKSLPCGTCGVPLAVLCSEDDLDAYRVLPLGALPADVEAALQQFRERPEWGTEVRPGTDPFGAGATPPRGADFGKYELLSRIGAGGMAEVFLARQVGLMGFEKKVVLKRVLPGLSADPSFVDMFLREARLAAQVSHQNVVQIFDLGQVGSQYFMAMEYVPGWDLHLLLTMTRRFHISIPIEVCCRIVADVCAGLHAAHTTAGPDGKPLRIVHRDVSPQNVLVSEKGAVKLTDFGIAKAADTLESTRPGVVKGKFPYMAPEMLREGGAANADLRVDVYAAGLLLYECLTHQQPFKRDTELATFKAILQSTVPPLSVTRPDAPFSLQAVLDAALARDPDERLASAGLLQGRLEQVLVDLRRPCTSAHIAAWLVELGAALRKKGAMLALPSALPASRPTDGDSQLRTRVIADAKTPAKRNPGEG